DQLQYVDNLIKNLIQAQSISFQTIHADSLPKGLQILSRHKIDVVLLDLNLLYSHGLDTFYRVRNQFPNIPIVVLSGEEDDAGFEAVRSGAQDWLAIDRVNPENLERAITRAVERDSLQSVSREYASKLESSLAQLRRSMDAIRESESKWRTVFEQALDPFLLVDPNTKMILDVNKSICDILHYSKKELIGRQFTCLFQPEEELSREEMLKGIQIRKRVVKSCDLLRSEGTICPMDLSLSLISWGENRVILVTLHDISKHERAMGKLMGGFNYFARIIEGEPAIVCGIEPDGKTTFINPAGEKITGYSSMELLGRNWWETLYPGDEYRQVEQLLRKFRDSEQRDVRNHQMILTTKDGEKRTILWNSINHHKEDGVLIEIIGIGQDITERQQAEEALRTSEENFHTLFDTVDDFLFILDSDGNILNANMMAIKCLGYPGAELQSMNFIDLIHPDYLKNAALQMKNLLSGEIFTCSTPLMAREGWMIPVETNISYGQWNGQVALFCVARDRATSIQMEKSQQLTAVTERANRLKDEFLANMSHELRTPLNTVLGMVELLQREIDGSVNDEQKKSLNLIEKSSQHLLSLINGILDLSKMGADKTELTIQPVAVEQIAFFCLQFVKIIAHQKKIKLTSVFENNPVSIFTDERILKQILINLLSNAVKFTPDDGSVGLEIVGDEKDRILHFTVWDTGIGIAPEDKERVFQPFTQLESGLTRRYAGTGLGLTLVSRMTELLGGTLSLETKPNHGSRFTISLSYDAAAVDDTQQPDIKKNPEKLIISDADHTQGLENVSILVADDDDDSIAIIKKYLTSLGCIVIIAHNSKEAIEKTIRERPDLIIMDIQMPEMDGLEAIRRIRSTDNLNDIPIIALTALAMMGDRERCLSAGADEYLSKPMDLDQLVELINELINK
ncbi:MAG: PAS domain S-box protein, partial [Candidatus Electryoneaceae bacterium]|nr:PAS domain S-box protein [Candidatus Electryoneaceae bacterium]